MCVLLGVSVKLGEDRAQHRPGFIRGTAGAAPQPNLLQQPDKNLCDPALRPARTERLDLRESTSSLEDRRVWYTLPALCVYPD